ncbi:MAG: hypothetical protein AVO38_04360 [delta proteobacterium ML8_D]|nr:MAG: hypothetical protein AVO38_04360 [delta proteobacterium ML8_D]
MSISFPWFSFGNAGELQMSPSLQRYIVIKTVPLNGSGPHGAAGNERCGSDGKQEETDQRFRSGTLISRHGHDRAFWCYIS